MGGTDSCYNKHFYNNGIFREYSYPNKERRSVSFTDLEQENFCRGIANLLACLRQRNARGRVHFSNATDLRLFPSKTMKNQGSLLEYFYSDEHKDQKAKRENAQVVVKLCI